MKRLALTLLLFFCAITGAAAETCTSNAAGRWTVIGTGPWTGCTPTADDTFNVASGHRVEVAGTVTVTTGNIVVQSGGELDVLPGFTLSQGASLRVQDGGKLTMSGQRVAGPCYVEREVDYTAAAPVINTGCDLTNAATTDYILWSDEDPTGEHTFTNRTVVTGPGRASGRNVYKPAPARWVWSDITAISGRTITWDIDEVVTSGSLGTTPNIPYSGTRGNPTTTAITAANMTLTRLEGGRMTRASVAAAHGSIATVNGDLTGYYLYANETVANAADPTFCSGKYAKILHTAEGAAGPDVLYVAGNLANCTSATWRIIPFGVRRGDEFYVVRPAQINGVVGATLTGYVAVESGATLNVRLAIFRNLGFLDRTAVSPNLARHCNFCLYQSSTSPTATITGYLEDSALIRLEHATSDTAHLNFISKISGGAGDLRYPNAGLLNMSGLAVERLFVYGTRDASNANSAGGHGLYIDGAKNLKVDGIRVQRTSDDALGIELSTNTTGTATDYNSVEVRRAILLESIAESDLSQESFEVTAIDQTNARGENDHLIAGMRAYDVLALGAYSRPLHLVVAKGTFERFVTGGQQFENTSVQQPWELFNYTNASNAITMLTHGSVVRDSILNNLAEDFTSAVTTANYAYGLFYDSILNDGFQLQAVPGTFQVYSLNVAERTFIRHDGSTIAAIETAAVNWAYSAKNYDDSVLVSTTAPAIINNCVTGFPVRAYRFMYLTGAAGFWPGGAGVEGPWALCALGAGNTFTGGGYYSALTSAADSFDLVTGSTLSDTCFETTEGPSNAFGARLTASTKSKGTLLPNHTTDTEIGLLVGDIDSDDVCEKAKPRQIGISQVGMAHVLLGDFAMEQFYPVFTSRPGIINTIAAGGVGQPSAPQSFP